MKQKGFSGVLVLIFVVTVAAGAYFLGKSDIVPFFGPPATTSRSPAPEVGEPPSPPQVPVDDATVNWKVYKSEKDKVEFSYPDNFEITKEYVKTEYPSLGNRWNVVEFKDKQAGDDFFLKFEANPDGYGPFVPTKSYSLGETANGQVKIFIEKDIEYSEDAEIKPGENKIWMIATTTGEKLSNGNWYAFHLTYTGTHRDYEQVFETVLSTFKFLD